MVRKVLRTADGEADDDWEEEDLAEAFRDHHLEGVYDHEQEDLAEAFRDRDLMGDEEQ